MPPRDASFARDLRLVATQDTSLRIAKAVALIAGVREGVEAHHAARVATLAAAVASAAGLDAVTIGRCRVAGWLHDIGMVALPDAVLGRACTVDATLRTHATIGASLVARVPELAASAAAVRHHHEHYDGSGYPDGQAGAVIPIEARIITCADQAATALPTAATHPRALAAAKRRMASLSGNVLDPALIAPTISVVTAEYDALAESLPRSA